MFHYLKLLSLAFAAAASLLPGHHSPAPARTAPVTAIGASWTPAPAAQRPDGETPAHWNAVDQAEEAQAAADKAAADKAAADKAAADAAAAATAPAAPAYHPAFSNNPGTAAVRQMIVQAFSSMGQAAVDWGLRVAACESGYNPNAYNPDGASGVFQFMPGTFRGTPYGGQNIFDAQANVSAAAWYFGQHGGGAWSCK